MWEMEKYYIIYIIFTLIRTIYGDNNVFINIY
jgi:hypothetical protein